MILTPAKTVIDILTGLLKITPRFRSDATIFNESVVPVYDNLSHIVTDYLVIFCELRAGLLQSKSQKEIQKHADVFSTKRHNFLALRRKTEVLCEEAPKLARLKTFHPFFRSAKALFLEFTV